MTEVEAVTVGLRWLAVGGSLGVLYLYPTPRAALFFGVVLALTLLQLVAPTLWPAPLDAAERQAWEVASLLVSGAMLGGVVWAEQTLRARASRSSESGSSPRAAQTPALLDREREDQLRDRALQQEAVANLGRRILGSGDVEESFDDAVHTVARTLGVPGCALFEFVFHRRSLVLRAGAGRMSDALDTALSTSPEHHLGLALAREQRVIVDDLDASELRRPSLLPYAKAKSAVAVVVPGRERPFGVLSAHSSDPSRFSEEDAHFLQGVANLLSAAIEQSRSRAEIDRGRERALQAQKLEALGRLSGGIAHDFNNMLHAIVGNTELALSRVPDGSPPSHNLRQVLSAAQRARDLIQQVLTFGLRSRPERRPVAVEGVIDEVVVLMRGSLPHEIEIHKRVRMRGATVTADSTQLYQVLVNLCTNAGHAMRSSGGVLDIEIDGVDLSEREGQRLGVPAGSYVRITIRDTGHGIRPEIRDRIFEPFFSAAANPEAPGEGTGMGLAVVHGIVDSHGGAIRVESEPGAGTSFEVLLPQAQATWEVTQPLPVPERAAQGRARILFVDDEPALVSMTDQALGALGYHVTGMTSSLEALERFRASPDSFDVVVLDQNMPNLHGDALAKELIELRPDLPIILCTGYTDEVTPDDARALGVREYLTKPLAIETLASAVRRALAGAGVSAAAQAALSVRGRA